MSSVAVKHSVLREESRKREAGEERVPHAGSVGGSTNLSWRPGEKWVLKS